MRILARRYGIGFKRPAVFDDRLEIAAWASDMKRSEVERHDSMRLVAELVEAAQLRGRHGDIWQWATELVAELACSGQQ